jgi:hypothetical protein
MKGPRDFVKFLDGRVKMLDNFNPSFAREYDIYRPAIKEITAELEK